jgi:hypothetical protein
MDLVDYMFQVSQFFGYRLKGPQSVTEVMWQHCKTNVFVTVGGIYIVRQCLKSYIVECW